MKRLLKAAFWSFRDKPDKPDQFEVLANLIRTRRKTRLLQKQKQELRSVLEQIQKEGSEYLGVKIRRALKNTKRDE